MESPPRAVGYYHLALVDKKGLRLGGPVFFATANGTQLIAIQEAPVGIEPTNGGFADLCLTTWLRRQRSDKVAAYKKLG